MTPNIKIFTSDEFRLLYKQKWYFDQNNISPSTINFLKKELNPSTDEAIFVLTAGYVDHNTKIIKEFISEKKLKKIYFFLEDTFRLYTNKSKYDGENNTLYSSPLDTKAHELDILIDLISNTKIEYEIYHCEDNTRILEENYNLKIKYFDFFCADVSAWQMNFPPFTDFISENEMLKFKNFNENFTYKICNFNRRKTTVRRYIASILCQESDNLVTYQGDLDLEKINLNLFNYKLFRSDIKNKVKIGLKTLNDNRKFLFNESYNTADLGNLESYDQSKNIVNIQESFVQIVSETKFISPMPNFSEKTIKSILSFRPFIIMAPPYTLRLIKNLGLQTFDKWWDESYDEVENHYERFEKIYDLCQYIQSLSFDELQNILKEMKSVLLYNRSKLFLLKNSMWKYSQLRDSHNL